MRGLQVDVESLRREHYNATVVEVNNPHEDLLVLRVRPDAPIPGYEAGQWTMLGLGLWEERVPGCPTESLTDEELGSVCRRPYSLSSSILARDGQRLLEPDENTSYEFFLGLARSQAMGGGAPALTARLFALRQGDRLWVAEQPQGNYTLEHVQPDDDVLFLATGTGEAPHNRMIWELLRRKHHGRIASVVTVRRLADLAYRPVHERLVQMFSQYRYVPVATREPNVAGARLQSMLQSGALSRSAGFTIDPTRCHVFLCGNPGMLGRRRKVENQLVYPQPAGMIELLKNMGYRIDPPDGVHVHFERY